MPGMGAKKTFRLAAPARNDIGYEFYVISLWSRPARLVR